MRSVALLWSSRRRFFRYGLVRSLLPVQLLLGPVERQLARRYESQGLSAHPPVFIIGPPRSGSTLLYKVLTDRYRFVYFTNLTAHLPRLTVLGWLLGRTLRAEPAPGDYEIAYGHLQGLGAPSECGEFWYRWFPRGLHVYVGAGVTPPAAIQELRREVGGLSGISGRSVIFKNLYNSMRLDPLVEAFPDASFLICRRDEVDTATSVVIGRQARQRDPAAWWSLPPREVATLVGRDMATQVAGQIVHTYRQIERDCRRLGTERFLDVRYEDLCEDVHGTLDRIALFLAARGCSLTEVAEVPRSFEISRPTSGSGPTADELRRALDEIRSEARSP